MSYKFICKLSFEKKKNIQLKIELICFHDTEYFSCRFHLSHSCQRTFCQNLLYLSSICDKGSCLSALHTHTNSGPCKIYILSHMNEYYTVMDYCISIITKDIVTSKGSVARFLLFKMPRWEVMNTMPAAKYVERKTIISNMA